MFQLLKMKNQELIKNSNKKFINKKLIILFNSQKNKIYLKKKLYCKKKKFKLIILLNN